MGAAEKTCQLLGGGKCHFITNLLDAQSCLEQQEFQSLDPDPLDHLLDGHARLVPELLPERRQARC